MAGKQYDMMTIAIFATIILFTGIFFIQDLDIGMGSVTGKAIESKGTKSGSLDTGLGSFTPQPLDSSPLGSKLETPDPMQDIIDKSGPIGTPSPKSDTSSDPKPDAGGDSDISSTPASNNGGGSSGSWLSGFSKWFSGSGSAETSKNDGSNTGGDSGSSTSTNYFDDVALQTGAGGSVNLGSSNTGENLKSFFTTAGGIGGGILAAPLLITNFLTTDSMSAGITFGEGYWMLMSDSTRLSWQDSVMGEIADALSMDNFISEICEMKVDLDTDSSGGMVRADVGGLPFPVASVKGERTVIEHINESNKSQMVKEYFYKFEYWFNYPSSVYYNEFDEVTFDIIVYGDRKAKINQKNITVKEGETFAATGSDMKTYFRKEFYNEICMHFDEPILDYEGKTQDKICDVVVGYEGNAEDYQATVSSSSSTTSAGSGVDMI